MSKEKCDRSLQQDVHGENLNDFVSSISAAGRLRMHAEHDQVRKAERRINKFTKFPDKNRFLNACTFSQGSIDLLPEMKNDCPYINASILPCPGGALIMAQAPMKETIIDFYRLIWQQQINTIICLVNLEDKEQCYAYFDRRAGKKITSRKRFRVRTVAVRPEGKNIVHYELKIENYLEKGNITSRVLNVISIIGWEPDCHFDPKVIVSAIHNADALSRLVPSSPSAEPCKPAPMLIHGCSGIRRTGVFALAYIFSKQIIVKRQINLCGMIDSVRMLRYGVLRHKNSFYLLLEVIIVLITETGLLKPGSESHVHAMQVVKQMYTTSKKKKDKESPSKTAFQKRAEPDSLKSIRKSKKKKNKLDDDDDEENEDSSKNSSSGKKSNKSTKSPKSSKSARKKKEKKGSKEKKMKK